MLMILKVITWSYWPPASLHALVRSRRVLHPGCSLSASAAVEGVSVFVGLCLPWWLTGSWVEQLPKQVLRLVSLGCTPCLVVSTVRMG